jgi:hypothetical protein
LISKPNISRPVDSGYRFNVIDAGDMWRVLNRTDITDYKEMKYPGFRASFGIDPNTGSHVIVYLDYPKQVYNREELEDPNSDIGKSIKKKIQDCLICSTMNQMSNESNGNPKIDQMSSTSYIDRPREPDVDRGIPRNHGEVVSPKYLPAIASIGQKVFCTKLGGMASSVFLSLAADIMSGWSSDPGQKAAFRQISDQFIEQMGMCNENDIESMKGDIAKLYDSWQKDKNVFKAVKGGMLKDVGDSLRENGVNITASKNTQTQYSLSGGFRPRRSSVD